MNPRAKLWLAFALVILGAAWRLYAIASVEGLNEVHYAEGHLFPTPLAQADLNATIGEMHQNFVFNTACDIPPGLTASRNGHGWVADCDGSLPS